MPWIVGGAVVGSALIGSSSASKAAKGQEAAAREAAAEQKRQFEVTRADQAPWLQTGQAGVRRIGELLGFGERGPTTQVSGPIERGDFDAAAYLAANPDVARAGVDPYGHYLQYGMSEGRQGFKLGAQSFDDSAPLLKDFTGADLTSEPGYEFRLSQGNKAIENAARARGMYMSPSTVKELLRYGQDYASGEYQNAYNRDMSNRTTKFNMLSGVSGTGQTAANTVANAGANMATNVGNLMTGAANARGAAGIAGANAWSNAAGTLGNWYQQNQMLDKIGSWRTPSTVPFYGVGGAPY